MRDSIEGHGVSHLPSKLAKKREIIIHVNSTRGYLKYVLLSVLHYDEVVIQYRRKPTKYQWEGELNFWNIFDNIKISDVHKIEELNKLKINVHVWKGKSLTIRCNDNSAVTTKAVHILLFRYQGLQHYCGIMSLKRLYCDRNVCQNYRLSTVWHEHFTKKREEATTHTLGETECIQKY